jgi:hypothetical protein
MTDTASKYIHLPDENRTRVHRGSIALVTTEPAVTGVCGGTVPPRIVLLLTGPHRFSFDCKDADDQFERYDWLLNALSGEAES